MYNPYEVMYDAVMDIFRWAEVKDDAGYTKQKSVPVSYDRPCRYSSSGLSDRGVPNPAIVNSHKLFCGLDEDIREGDHLVITLWTGKVVEADVGECHPYSYQWQCEVKREGEA